MKAAAAPIPRATAAAPRAYGGVTARLNIRGRTIVVDRLRVVDDGSDNPEFRMTTNELTSLVERLVEMPAPPPLVVKRLVRNADGRIIGFAEMGL